MTCGTLASGGSRDKFSLSTRGYWAVSPHQTMVVTDDQQCLPHRCSLGSIFSAVRFVHILHRSPASSPPAASLPLHFIHRSLRLLNFTPVCIVAASGARGDIESILPPNAAPRHLGLSDFPFLGRINRRDPCMSLIIRSPPQLLRAFVSCITPECS